MNRSVLRRACRAGLLTLMLGVAAMPSPPGLAAAPAGSGDHEVLFSFEPPDYTAGELDGQQGWSTEWSGEDWTIATAHPYGGTQHLRAQVRFDGMSSAAFGPTRMDVGTGAFSIASARIAIANQGSGSTTFLAAISSVANDYSPDTLLPVTRIRIRPDGSIQALKPGSGLVATTGTITDTAYHELKIIAENGGSRTIEVCLDGQSIFTGTNNVPASSAQAFIDKITMQANMEEGSIGSVADFDDIRIVDAASGGCADPSAWNFDGVLAPALPTGWTSDAADGGVAWATQTDDADSPPNAAYTPEAPVTGEASLYSAPATVDPVGGQLSFRHRWNTESDFDGGVLEISIDGGDYADIVEAGGRFVEAGYNGTLVGSSNPIGLRPAWTGTQADYVTTTVDLPASANGRSVRLRWRFGSDLSVAASEPNGWWVDTVVLSPRELSTHPAAVLAPEHVELTLAQGDTASTPLTLANAGGGTLTFDIPALAVVDPVARAYVAPEPVAPAAATFSRGSGVAAGLRGRAAPFGEGAGIDIAQMDDHAPVASNSISCGVPGVASDANSWWRRFYFADHSRIGGSATIRSVTIASESGPVTPVTVNLYAVPHGAPPESIPTAQLILIGSGSGSVGGTLATTTIPVSGTIDDTVTTDLVVEYRITGSTGGEFFPGGNPSPQTHATFVSSPSCRQDVPTNVAALGYPDFHLIMIVNVQDTPLPAECSDAEALAWLDADPATGSVSAATSAQIGLSVDASGLALGRHDATVCMTTNDPSAPVLAIPLQLDVTAPDDTLFKDGFEAD